MPTGMRGVVWGRKQAFLMVKIRTIIPAKAKW